VGDRLYRSPTDRVIAGVAGGMATWLNIDPSLIRVAWILLGVFSGGIFVLVYIVMMIVVPLPPPGWVPRPRPGAPAGGWQEPGVPPGAAPGTTAGWQQPAAWQPGTPPPVAGTTPPPDTTWTSVPPPARNPDIDANRVGIVAGVVLVLLGIWFLVDRYVHINWDLVWPVVVVVIGLAIIAVAIQRGRSAG
jgi:phage shock protein PspC (stress-responsive transcriptional regulator)